MGQVSQQAFELFKVRVTDQQFTLAVLPMLNLIGTTGNFGNVLTKAVDIRICTSIVFYAGCQNAGGSGEYAPGR